MSANPTVPDFTELGARKLADLLEKGYVITGVCFERQVDGTQPQRGFVDFAGFVGWHQPEMQPRKPLMDEMDKEAVRLLRGFLECPFILDEATCSSLGLEETMRRNPRQVVVNMSCALLRIREARALIASVDAAHGVADMKGGQDVDR